MAKVAVLGAGVVGLSTALNIQILLPEAHVTVIADKFVEDTTSYGSGGLFVPTFDAFPNDPPERIWRWCRDSWDFFERLVTGPEAGQAGGVVMTGFYLRTHKHHDPLYQKLAFNYHELTPEELQKMRIRPMYKYGTQVTTVVLNQARYLPWLMNRIKRNGGTFETRKIQSLEELVGHYDVCVTCCGLASRELLTDSLVYPCRGHLVKVHAPWVKHWYYTEDCTYIIPSEEFVNLGGFKQDGNESQTVDPAESQDVLERCGTEFPLIKGAMLKTDWVGLRPCRRTVRLEAETLTFPSGRVQCVHNYGHGANGVALSWGSSLEAAQLVQKLTHQAKL